MAYRNSGLAVIDPSVPDSFLQINGGASFDQPALRRLLWDSELRLAVLPMEHTFKCMTFLEGLDSRPVA